MQNENELSPNQVNIVRGLIRSEFKALLESHYASRPAVAVDTPANADEAESETLESTADTPAGYSADNHEPDPGE